MLCNIVLRGESNMFEYTNEYKEISKQFRKTFGYGVPLSMIPSTVIMSDLIENIQKCIDNKEDNLLEMFGVQDNTDILY